MYAGWLIRVVAATVLLAGCATLDRGSYHGVVMDNKGPERIYDIRVLYGDFSIPRVPRALGRGSGTHYNDQLRVPDEATIQWRSERQENRVVVPIRRHIPNAAFFDGDIIFEINGDHVRVLERRQSAGFPTRVIYDSR